MNARQRFLETMRAGNPDRAPMFNEGYRSDVVELWQSQGFLEGRQLDEIFNFDTREEISLELRTEADLRAFSRKSNGLELFQSYLDAKEIHCMPSRWKEKTHGWHEREHVLMLMVHWGFFQTLGVSDWNSFSDYVLLLADQPEFVREAMKLHGEFAAKLTERILKDVEIDAVIFSEPIGGNHGSLISPQMFQDMGLASYYPILEVLERYSVDILIWRTYANTMIIFPVVLDAGINCLWACETNLEEMDYRDIRQEFGRDLRLIGGLDLDVLYTDKKTIKNEVMDKEPPLIADGGYIPLADGRVRKDISFENYRYYRQLLEDVTS